MKIAFNARSAQPIIYFGWKFAIFVVFSPSLFMGLFSLNPCVDVVACADGLEHKFISFSTDHRTVLNVLISERDSLHFAILLLFRFSFFVS